MMNECNYASVNGRKLEFFSHISGEECGYAEPQTDTYAVLHPKNEKEGVKYPLYVVLHSAGHDVFSALSCTLCEGNHDIYHAPEDMYALYPDCFMNAKGDWWWGGITALGEGDPARRGTALQPVERRVLAEIKAVSEGFPIDTERVYAVGNSMGGSGALGIGLNHGDIFAALIANVPAGVEHACDRCCLGTEKPDGFSIPEPPVVVDYSAQNDVWSTGHEKLYHGMEAEKYALVGYFGPFDHENNTAAIRKVNDLVLTFDALSVRKNEAYPAFTNASCNDPIPWKDNIKSELFGQVNAFFRYRNREDTEAGFSMELWLADSSELQTKHPLPDTAETDITLRRVQRFAVKPGEAVRYQFGDASGIVKADETGHITVEGLTVTQKKQQLILYKPE